MTEASIDEGHARTVHLFGQAAAALKKSWRHRANAKQYHHYATTHPLYTEMSRRLVALAGLQPDTMVVDLACGTGIATAAILERMGASVGVIAIDQAEAQLELARQHIAAGNVRFIHGRAEEIDRLVRQPIDAVICNSAFWQMKTDETLSALRNILQEDGRFVFNMRSWLFPSLEKRLLEPEVLTRAVENGSRGEASLANLMRRIAKADYGYTAPERPQPDRKAYEARFMASFREARFEIVSSEGYVVKQTPQAIYEWFKIPLFRALVLPGMEVETGCCVLDKAFATWQPTQDYYYSCSINFVARRGRRP